VVGEILPPFYNEAKMKKINKDTLKAEEQPEKVLVTAVKVTDGITITEIDKSQLEKWIKAGWSLQK
jgi:hypothetical protein